MRKIAYLFLFFLLASCGSDKTASLSSDSPAEVTASNSGITVQSILSTMEKGRYREGELLVKFKSGVLSSSSLRTHQTIGAGSLRKFSIVPNLEHVKLPQGLSVRDGIVKYMSDPNVEYAEPNYIRRTSATPNDPLFLSGQQWALNDIKAPQAWDIATGSSGVIVAVIDTGVDITHPDLSANVGNGFNFINNTSNAMDDEGHGTHVSGISGAAGNNGQGIAGMMWNVQIMPLKILDASGSGSTADEIRAIEFAVAHGAKVINASFSGAAFSSAEFDALNMANSAGVLVMAAAGNGGGDFCDKSPANNNDGPLKCYPASYSLSNIISVAATDQSSNLAFFSNFGPNSVHVAAPGVSILSTLLPSTYGLISGTSQATPHVAGLAGLLWSHYTNFSYSQIRGTILRYVDPLNLPIMTGGRINAYKALSSLLTPTNLGATASSTTQTGLAWTDNATGEDGYKVERKTGGGSFVEITRLAANSTAYTDSSLTDGTTFTYRVRAFNSLPNPPGTASVEGNSLYSNEVSVTTPLNPPTGLTATSVTSTSVTVVWTNNSQAAQGFKVQRKSPASGFVEIATVGPNVTTFTDTGLSPQTAYTYQVAAFNSSAGDSAFSNPATVTTSSTSSSPPPSGGGGGGGCSIGARQNTPTAVADFAVLMVPLLFIVIVRRRR